jgi:hypothetical protein
MEIRLNQFNYVIIPLLRRSWTGRQSGMATRPAPKSKRIGKTADDIFTAPAAAAAGADGPRRRGRRPSHTEHWTKVTVVLFDRQIVFLDRLGADIRAASGVAISRAHVIRALIDALSESDMDLTTTRSESDLKAVLSARLGRHKA